MRKLKIALHLINTIIISTYFSIYLNIDYPKIGHDYSYFIPNLLDNYLHYKNNGLSIQWFTPSFGGGLPSFPNPQQIQFSLSALLTLLMNPWAAIIVSTIIFALIGYFSINYFITHSLSLNWQIGILGGLFFTFNGFFIERMAVGHLTFQTFPLIATLVVILFAPTIPKKIAGLTFSLVISLLIHNGSFYLFVVFVLSILVTLPLIYFIKPELLSCKRILYVIFLGGGLSVVMSASKLAAVFAFMRFFPRQLADYYATTGFIKGIYGIALQILGVMNLAPLLSFFGKDPTLVKKISSITGADYGYWEFDMSLSPVAIGIIFIGIFWVLMKPKEYIRLLFSKGKWIAGIVLMLFVWVTIEFSLAKGFIYPTLKELPILSSLHVNPRFTSAFIFPLVLSAVVIYNEITAKLSARRSGILFMLVYLLAVLSFSTYFFISTDIQNRSYDLTKSLEINRRISSGEDFTITGVESGIDNTESLDLHLSNLRPYEAIFGYRLENFFQEIVPGYIWNITDGYYNMTNPSGYVYPEINQTRPFERIPIEDKDLLEKFASYGNPGWKIPIYQQILDWLSGFAVFAGMMVLLFITSKWLVSYLIKNKLAIIH